MGENVKKESNAQSNSGIKILLIILIILMLAVLALLGYKMFAVDKTESNKTQNNVTENNSSEKEISSTTIPVEDTFALLTDHVDASKVKIDYYVLKSGKVILYSKTTEDSLFYYQAPIIDSEWAATMSVTGKELAGLPIIKRIKGFVGLGTDITSGLLLVAENGEVYTYGVSGWAEGKVEKAKFLDNYKVDDVVSYQVVGGCSIPEDPTAAANFKTCGGEYHIIDQDGNTQHYQVNTDGTLTQK